jgi:N-acetylglucosamine-6-sulfatase
MVVARLLLGSGVTFMQRAQIWFGILAAFWIGIGVTAVGAQPVSRQGACRQIRAACEQAGFTQGGAQQGTGLWVDCIRPIIRGTPPRPRTSKPLPQIDPQLVAACKAQNPSFGERGQKRAPPDAAPPAATPPPPATPPAGGPTPRSETKQPNIVFVLTDDLSWNLVQYMPHVLKMQKDGMTFANYFVTDSLCCPSRSSIFTGRYPHNTGIFRNQGEDGGYLAFHNRHHERATFASALSAVGYRTAMLGKYLNGYLPVSHAPAPGWTLWAVAGNGYSGFNYGLNRDGRIVRYGLKAEDYMTDVLSDVAVDFIKQSGNKPFLIEIATFAPHAPYTPAPRDADAFPGLQALRTAAFDASPDQDAPRWLKSHRALSPADMLGIDRDFRKRAQAVLAVDKMIGELQAAVETIGETNNTYFVFSSDNGYHLGEYRLGEGKQTAFDTDVHVPLVVAGPDITAGTTRSEVAQNIDLAPTFEDLANVPIPPTVDGHSLVPLLRGSKTPSWRDVALIEHHGPDAVKGDPDAQTPFQGIPPTYDALRTNTWTYVEYRNGALEYYDRSADPNELNNLASTLTAARKAELHNALVKLRHCHSYQACWAAGHLGDSGQL